MELWTGALSWWKSHDPIWRVLSSSQGISSWTPLKPQNSNPNLNPLASQLWSVDFITPSTPHIIPHRLPAFLEFLMPLKKLMLDSCKMVQKQSEASNTFLWHFFQVSNRILLHIILQMCPHVQIAFLKFTSCDNQALVGCIPIAAVAVQLNLKS